MKRPCSAALAVITVLGCSTRDAPTDPPPDSGDPVAPAPEGLAVAIQPSNPDTRDDLVAVVTAPTDHEGDAIEVSLAWRMNGTDRTDVPTEQVSEFLTERGQTWEVVVTATDGTHTLTATSAVVIGNAPPTAPTVRVEPETPLETEDIRCVVVTESLDPDLDAIRYAYSWTVDGEDLDGLDANVVPAGYTDRGQRWGCVATPNDSFEDGPVAAASTVVSPPDGSSAAEAGASCASILDDGYNRGSGSYWIDPDLRGLTEAFPAYCDMETDGGGWTLAALMERAADCGWGDGYWSYDGGNWTSPTWDTEMTSIDFWDYVDDALEDEVRGGGCANEWYWDPANDPKVDAKGRAFNEIGGSEILWTCGEDTGTKLQGGPAGHVFGSLRQLWASPPADRGITMDGVGYAMNAGRGGVMFRMISDRLDGGGYPNQYVGGDREIDGHCDLFWLVR